ncbi:hypothetical protein [Companilactobacillus ginsenosidimutans]|uniref:Uncharacterized protein n=1 Tax=Companilactobacillus ginsenosidimutans TaxID=1007676 RepID=A0A0H4QH52_9LACO|nr:hypothetical protein [Companilactobacillus ginsenosidimutans]AKP67277.1 hypothetical protein ABM34_06805 [Companilactobacillus ginsenosidimutans]
MSRILDITYWVIVCSVAILTVIFGFYSTESIFLDTSLLLFGIVWAKQYFQAIKFENDTKIIG